MLYFVEIRAFRAPTHTTPRETRPQVNSYSDKTLTCRDCGDEFQFSSGEQDFYASKGLTNQPSRCASCRSARKAQRGDFDGGSSYGGSSGYSDSPRPQREMHSVICDECGKETEVPFLPRGDRPVYCSDCFAKSRAR